jgi:hypothetical protein
MGQTMLNRILSLVVSLCLLANVSLGCATMIGAHVQAPVAIDAQVQDIVAMAGCGDHARTKGQSKTPGSHQSSACKTLCGSIMVQPNLVLLRTHFLQHIDIAMQTQTPSWDSSVDPPRPRQTAHRNKQTQLQI